MFSVLDSVLEGIHQEILAHPPERGGALYGPPYQPLVSYFELDATARNTSVLYTPSDALVRRIPEVERSRNLEFKGIVHSHPGGMDRFSGPDRLAVETALSDNPHLAFFLLPIVNDDPPRSEGDHITPLGRGRITWYAGHRVRNGRADIDIAGVHVIPIARDTDAVADMLRADAPVDGGVVGVEGRRLFTRHLSFPAGEMILMFGTDYPAAPPIALYTANGRSTEQLVLDWPMTTPAHQRLTNAVSAAITQSEPSTTVAAASVPRRLSRPRPKYKPLRHKTRGTKFKSGLSFHSETIDDELTARTKGLFDGALEGRSVVVVGAGSVGSYAAEQFVRTGVKRIALVDHDHVEISNLSRSVYQLTDVNQPKVEALKKRLLSINPGVEVQTHSQTIQEMPADRKKSLFETAALAFAATDDPEAQAITDHWAYWHKVPAVFCGLYGGAKAGEIFFTDPGQTPCFSCASAFRTQVEQDDEAAVMDYGTGRLIGEIALGANIQHVTSAALSVSFSILAKDDSPLRELTAEALKRNSTFVVLGMTPRYGIFEALFTQTPGQLAFQSIWLAPHRNPECPICGPVELRSDPSDFAGSADLGDIRAAIEAAKPEGN